MAACATPCQRFLAKWQKEVLPTLQSRRMWQEDVQNLELGDLVLLPCKDTARNEWPLARVIMHI